MYHVIFTLKGQYITEYGSLTLLGNADAVFDYVETKFWLCYLCKLHACEDTRYGKCISYHFKLGMWMCPGFI